MEEKTLNSVFSAIEQDYSYLWIKQKELASFREYMTTHLDKTDTLEDFVEHATFALSFFHDLHLYFIGVPSEHNHAQKTSPERITHEITDQYIDDKARNGPITTGRVENTAYLRLNSFAQGCEKNFQDLFEHFPEAEKFIVDLRTNGGGTGDLVRQLLSRLQGKHAALGVYSRSRLDKTDCTRLSDFKPKLLLCENPQEKQIVVLTSPLTASAAELATCYFQGIGARIIGGSTFGGLSGHDTFYTYNPTTQLFEKTGTTYPEMRQGVPWQNQLGLRIPRGIIYTPRKELVQEKGITPDIREAYQPTNGKDAALETALKLLR